MLEKQQELFIVVLKMMVSIILLSHYGLYQQAEKYCGIYSSGN